MEEIALRFVIGGAVVSLFALIGEVFTPKTFAGIFGAAPSIALATLGLTCLKHGAHYAATECRSMAIGAIAFVVYGVLCAILTAREQVHEFVIAAASWIAWLAVALSIFFAARAAGIV